MYKRKYKIYPYFFVYHTEMKRNICVLGTEAGPNFFPRYISSFWGSNSQDRNRFEHWWFKRAALEKKEFFRCSFASVVTFIRLTYTYVNSFRPNIFLVEIYVTTSFSLSGHVTRRWNKTVQLYRSFESQKCGQKRKRCAKTQKTNDWREVFSAQSEWLRKKFWSLNNRP